MTSERHATERHANQKHKVPGVGATPREAAQRDEASAAPPAAVKLSGDLPELSDTDVDAIAAEFQEIWHEAILTAVNRSGRLLLDRVYGGSVEAFRRRGRKQASLPRVARALGARGFRVNVAQLRRTVHRHLVLQELGEATDVASLVHLRPSHLDEVLALPSGERIALLLAGEANELTVGEVRALRTGNGTVATDRTEPIERTVSRPKSDRRRSRSAASPNIELKAAVSVIEEHEARFETVLQQLASQSVVDRSDRIAVLGVTLRLKRLLEQLDECLAVALRP